MTLAALLIAQAGVVAQTPAAQWLGPKPVPQVKRVVTVAPSLTETVIALEAGGTLVGVSRFDEQPEVATLPRVGGFIDPSIETIVALKPDLVVVQKAPGNQQPVEKLAQLGISVVALPLTTIADVRDAVIELGRVLHHEAKAAALVADIDQARARMREAAKHRPHPRVLVAYGYKPFVVAGPGSFTHELLEDCGAVNLAGKAPTAYPVYSLERAVALSPDVVIDAADVSDGRDEVQALPQLKRARWVTPLSKDLLHPGPGLGRALTGLCDLLAGPRGATGSRTTP